MPALASPLNPGTVPVVGTPRGPKGQVRGGYLQEWGEWMELGHEGWCNSVCVELGVERIGVGLGYHLF